MNRTQGIGSEQVKESKSLWDKFVTFLAMGGFLVILILGVMTIAILIDNMIR